MATASRVLNGSARTPAESIARRVREAAHELGYVANAQAQALARSATGLVGLVVHDIADPYFSSITRGAQRAAEGQRSQVLLAGAERNERAELKAVAAFAAYRTDAIILAGSRRSQHDVELATELGRYTANGGRVVTLGPSSIPKARHLDIRHRAGAADLVKALVGRGLTEFAILGGPRGAEHRPAACRGLPRCSGRGRPETAGRSGTASSTVRAVSPRRSSAGSNSTAVGRQGRVCLLVVNDVMALGAIAGLRSLGLSVPADAQVAGFDDIPPLRDFTPALTTVRLPLEEIGAKAVELALAATAVDPVHIDGEAVLRDSAG